MLNGVRLALLSERGLPTIEISARTWTQAAMIERRTQVNTGSMALAA
jgi:hypothetical protein